jgi:iron complex outermembrane receptor protein
MLGRVNGHSRLLLKCGVSALATMSAGFALPVMAQEQIDSTVETAQQAGPISEIVVTAQKRSQNLQDVPVAVSAVGAETLQTANISSAGELGKIVPSLQVFTTSGSVQPFLRGIGNPGSLVGNEGSAAVYIDGVYLVRVPASLLQLTGIERVEVLKGPQGTLFGRNASAGLMHIVTREPSDVPTFEGNIGYGNFNTFRANVYASAGLADGVAVDVSAMIVDQQDGWGENVATGLEYGKENTKAVRGKLRWEIGPDTEVTLIGDYTKSKNDFVAHSQYLYGGPRRGYDLPPYGLQPVLDFYDIEADSTPVNISENWGVSGRIEHDFGFGTATSITAYRDDDGFIVFDSDFSGQDSLLAELFGSVKQVSQELQLASNPGSSFDWLVGAYYISARSGYYPSRFTGRTFDPLTGGLPAVSDTWGESKVKSASVYGQVTVPLGDATNLTGGLRYTSDKLSGSGRSDFYIEGTTPVPGPTVTGKDSFEKLTYKVSLDHRFTDDFMVYASQSRGYKSGLFNTLPFTPVAAEPEVIDASELGFKAELLDRRVRLNGAVFYYDFKNAQFQQFNGPTVVIVNAPSARLWGGELEGQAAITDNFILRFSGGYLDTKYTDFPNAQTPIVNTNTDPALGMVGGYLVGLAPFDATGNEMVRAPKWTANIGANYDLETEVGRFNFDVNYAYTSSYAWDADNKLREPSHGLLDAQITYTFPDEHYSIRLYGKNLTKEKYYVAQIQSDSARGSSAMPGAPRTYGVDLLVKF